MEKKKEKTIYRLRQFMAKTEKKNQTFYRLFL